MVNHEAQSSAGAGNLSVKLDKLCGEYMNSVDWKLIFRYHVVIV